MELTPQIAETIAQEWLDAWNNHDLEAIMSHYAEDIVFYSPVIQRLLNDPTGCVKGKTALRAYFTKGLQAFPDLKFEPYHVLTGVNSFVIHYKSVSRNQLAAEYFVLNHQHQVIEVRAHYK